MQMIEGNEVAVWNDVSRFGPEPESKMAAAEEICASVGASALRVTIHWQWMLTVTRLMAAVIYVVSTEKQLKK